MRIPLSFLVIFVIMFLYASNQKYPTLANACYYLGQFYIIASLLVMYIENIQFLPSDDGENALKPKKAVLTRNNTYIFVILSLILAFNILIHLQILEDFANFLISKIGQFITFLLSLIIKGEDPIEITKNPTDEMMNFPPPGEPSLFAIILGYLLSAAAILFILYMIYLAVSFIIRYLKAHMYNQSKKPQSIDEDFYEVSEDLKATKHHRKSTFKFGSDFKERIRKRYSQEIKYQIKHGYDNKNYHTPNERSKDLLDTNQTNIDTLTKYYNIARYSDHAITSKEFHSIK